MIKSDECLEAFKKWTGLYLNGYAPEDAINWGFTEMVDNFIGGLTGTLMNDSEVAATCLENMSDDQWMVMPVPKSEKDGKLYNLINGSYSLSISSNSENPDAAWKLIEFLNRTDNSSEYCRLSGLIPIKKMQQKMRCMEKVDLTIHSLCSLMIQIWLFLQQWERLIIPICIRA